MGEWASAERCDTFGPPSPSSFDPVPLPFRSSTGSRAWAQRADRRFAPIAQSEGSASDQTHREAEASQRPVGRRGADTAEIIPLYKAKYTAARTPAPIRPLTATQAEYLDALRSSPQVFVLGPAGTGKTWIAATYAADLYRARQVSRIILTRPNVPCGRSLGFFPGVAGREVRALGGAGHRSDPRPHRRRAPSTSRSRSARSKWSPSR